MKNIIKKTRKQLSILLILSMAFTLHILTLPVLAAEDNSVTITNVPSMLWGGFGQYVEYEMDGKIYRTDEAPTSINRLAWSRMTQEQRRQTYDRLYTTSARKAAFGEEGFSDIVSWIRETNEWFIANRIWKSRIANRDFPELYQVFNENTSLSSLYSDYDQIAHYTIPQNVLRSVEREHFDKALEDVRFNYDIGKQFYQKAVDMRAKNIGVAVSFTVMQCTQMLSDMLFVPSVVQGATVATSGMYADVVNVLLQAVGLDGGSLAEKVNNALEGEAVHLSLGEQIKLRAAVIDTFVIQAEKCKNAMDEKMGALRLAHSKLKEKSEGIDYYEMQRAKERQEAKESYQTNLDETFVSPEPIELGEDDEVYITLAFRWKTEAELRSELFSNRFDEWLEENSTEDTSAYPEAAEIIFNKVLEQKNFLDDEVNDKVDIICEKLITAYNSAYEKVEALKADFDLLKNKADSTLPEDEYDLYRIPVGNTFFYGTEAFRSELENFAYTGRAYDEYYTELQSHISEYRTKTENLLDDVKALKDTTSEFYENIEADVQDVIFYLDLLERLDENYMDLYTGTVWEIDNDPLKVDPSINYDKIPYINPYHHDEGAEYRVDACETRINENNLPQEVYTLDALFSTRPAEIYNQTFTLYQELSETSKVLEKAYSASFDNDNAYKEKRTQYYAEMDAWLDAYKDREIKMANALASIKSIMEDYEASWEGTFFLGGYDIYNAKPYLYSDSIVQLSAFDITGLRDYIRNGGNTFSLYNKLKAIERKAEIYEVEVANLIGQINALHLEMEHMSDNALFDYAASKGIECKWFYSLRIEYGLDSKWGNLTRDSGDTLAYFNIGDIPQICDILKGETEDFIFMRNAIKEIRSYLDANTVAAVPVSNRLYEIYKKATGINQVYMSSTFSNYSLMAEEKREEMLNLYANPADEDDILNTITSVRHKHEGVSYTYPPSPHDGVNQYNPVGEPASTAAFPGSASVQLPMSHPLAVGTRSFTATLYVYNDGWSVVQTLSGTENSLRGIIDTERDMLTMPFTGLEDGKDYRIDWDIVHAPYGTALHETGSYYFTYTSPDGVFTTVELNKDTYDSADVTVVNNSGMELIDQYVYLEGYDENGNLVVSQREALNSLDTGKTTTVKFTFDEVAYTVRAYVAGEEGQTPPTPIRLEIEGGNSSITVPEIGEAANTSTPFTAKVYDQYVDIYEDVTIDWSLSPQLEGVSISEEGIVTVTSAAGAFIGSESGTTCTVTATIRGTTIVGSGFITIKRDSAIASQILIKRGTLHFADGDIDYIYKPVKENSSKSYTYSVILKDQYGTEIPIEQEDFTWTSTGASSGVTMDNNEVIITSDANNGSFTLAVSHAESMLSAQITIYINDEDVDVDWIAVENKITGASYIYGDRNDKAGPLGQGTATIGDTLLEGNFSYKDPAGIKNAGEQTITVIFTVTTPGDYLDLQLEHDVAVTIAKKEVTGTLIITGNAAVGETLTAVFTSEINPTDYDIIWSSGGNIVKTASTYTITTADQGRTITAKVVGKGNYTGEIGSQTGISIPPAIPDNPPGTGGNDSENDDTDEDTGNDEAIGGSEEKGDDESSNTSKDEDTDANTDTDEASTSIDQLPPQNEQDLVTETITGVTTTTVVDRDKLDTYVEAAENGSGIVIPVSENNTSTAQLPLETFKTMAEKDMFLTVQSGKVAISIPSASIDISAVKELFGSDEEHEDISISITISQLSPDETASLKSAAAAEELEILDTPVAFSVTASSNGKNVEVINFNQYVQRRFEITKEIAESVTTALVFEEDNTFRHVPTSIYSEDGRYYVIIASRTNSSYLLVSHNVSFDDTIGRWYEDAAKEMAGRRIIQGIGNNTFAGDRDITRAEFAAIIIRALGLPAKGESAFSDVSKDAWYSGAVAAATKYGIVSGRGNNKFGPMDKITREEAMQIIFNASKLTSFNGVEKVVNIEAFSDYNARSQWAAEAVDFNINNGLIVGSNNKINPKANITRGEAATVILRLLQKANLVDSKASI